MPTKGRAGLPVARARHQQPKPAAHATPAAHRARCQQPLHALSTAGDRRRPATSNPPRPKWARGGGGGGGTGGCAPFRGAPCAAAAATPGSAAHAPGPRGRAGTALARCVWQRCRHGQRCQVTTPNGNTQCLFSPAPLPLQGFSTQNFHPPPTFTGCRRFMCAWVFVMPIQGKLKFRVWPNLFLIGWRFFRLAALFNNSVRGGAHVWQSRPFFV